MEDDRQEGQRLACAYAGTHARRDRDLAVAAHQQLATIIACTLARHRGALIEELMQVANVGLLEALERYDPDRGVQFRTFAQATIRGTVKHHLRSLWCLHTPRRTQDLCLLLPAVIEQAAQQLHRTPTTEEVAERAGVTRDDVVEARNAAANFKPLSLGDMGEPKSGGHCDDLEAVELRADLEAILARLPVRMRQLLTLRFIEQWSQAEIAALLGISQVAVSRQIITALSYCRSYRTKLAIA